MTDSLEPNRLDRIGQLLETIATSHMINTT